MTALGLVVVSVACTPGTENLERSASVSQASVGQPGRGNGTGPMEMGGWGRGGYPMVTVPGSGGGSEGGGPTVNGTANAAGTSVNWSGYAAAGTPGQFTSVSTSWTQPAVTCGATNMDSSFWAGLDGDGTDTVEQTGTEADCTNGTASYSGWWEMFPNAPVFYDNPVDPGDVMSASVTANGNGNFTLTLSDTTQGWTQTTQQTSADAQLGSAEIIAEAPSDGTVLPLSNFGTVTFSNDTVNGAPIGNSGAASLTMVSQGGVTEATPSALAGGNSFTVTWDSSGGAAAAAAAANGASGAERPGSAYGPCGNRLTCGGTNSR
jgi:hypothetical protein